MNSAERLKKSQAEGTSKHNDFHIELLKLRQNWRLKKVGNTILGDLSYKTGKQWVLHTILGDLSYKTGKKWVIYN